MAVSHTHRMRVRYHHCDPQGVVFNATYLTYFDDAITELWRERCGSYTTMTRAGIDLMVVEVTARFFAPASSDEEIDLTVEIESLGRTSMITQHRITRGDELLVEGRMVHVFVETPANTKTEIPAMIRVALEGGRPVDAEDWAVRG